MDEIPQWRLQGAADALKEAIEMNNTQAFDIAVLVVDHLQSWEFFAMLIIFFVYRLLRAGVTSNAS